MNSEINRVIESNKELKLGIKENEIYACEDINLDRTIENLDKLLDPIIEDKFLNDVNYIGYGLSEIISIDNYEIHVYDLGNGITGYALGGTALVRGFSVEEMTEKLEEFSIELDSIEEN